MIEAGRLSGRGWAAVLAWLVCTAAALVDPRVSRAAEPAGGRSIARSQEWDDGELARKYEILRSPDWQRAIAEFAAWLDTQTVYSRPEVRRIKLQFNERVAAMSSFELEYLLESMAAKMRLLDTPQARDAKAWLGEYLAAMSDARRARELGNVPNILDMSAAQLWEEIGRIDSLRQALQQRQQGVESRQDTLARRAVAGRQATSAASRAAAARQHSAPSHSPYRSGGGTPPFSDVQPRRMSIGVGMFGACIML